MFKVIGFFNLEFYEVKEFVEWEGFLNEWVLVVLMIDVWEVCDCGVGFFCVMEVFD